jgi:hypothetical protein
MACVVSGGQLVSTGIRQSFKNFFRNKAADELGSLNELFDHVPDDI